MEGFGFPPKDFCCWCWPLEEFELSFFSWSFYSRFIVGGLSRNEGRSIGVLLLRGLLLRVGIDLHEAGRIQGVVVSDILLLNHIYVIDLSDVGEDIVVPNILKESC